jgi:hypothetical protein
MGLFYCKSSFLDSQTYLVNDKLMAARKKIKAYETTKTRITIFTLILAFPLGLVLMWMWADWPKWLKIVISLMPVILYILLLVLAFLIGTQFYLLLR